MRDGSLRAFRQLAGVDVIAPQPSPDGRTIDPARGITPHGMVHTLDEANAVVEFFRQQHVEGLILCPLDFGDERSAAKVAEQLAVPVLLYATREPPGRNDAGLTRVSDSYCGNLSMASALYRRQIPFHYAGLFFPDEPDLRNATDTFARAVSVVSGLRGARLGQVGVRPPTFETVAYSEAAMISSFGQNVIHADLSEIVDLARSFPGDAQPVQKVVADIRSRFATITVSETYLLEAARLEVALTRFWEENGLSGLAMQCWPSIQRLMGISVCATYGRLTEQGMLTACEADIIGVLSMLANYRASLQTTVPHFVDWTIQHRTDPNRLLAWHCGNAPACLARDPDKVALRSRRDMIGTESVEELDPQAGLAQFQLKPGTVTFCRLAEYDGEWKMLIAPGEVVPSDETLAGTWSWVGVHDHAGLYRTLIEEGFIHHASMIHGDQRAVLELACKFLGIRPVVVP
jgi:L-fucose isomerase-like protein